MMKKQNDELSIQATALPTDIHEPAPKKDTPTTVLPADYLKDGYYAIIPENGKKYLRPAYVSSYAKELASAMRDMRPTDFATLMREMKRSRSRSLPFEARQTAACEMLPKAIALVRKKHAPQLLVAMVEANLSALHTDEDWTAIFRHFEAVYGFLNIPEAAIEDIAN